MSETYGQIYDDEWFTVPRAQGMHIACCDCSLTHLVKVRVRDGHIQLRFVLAPRNTATLRRASRKKHK